MKKMENWKRLKLEWKMKWNKTGLEKKKANKNWLWKQNKTEQNITDIYIKKRFKVTENWFVRKNVEK